jgi:hypothetical protein
MQRLIRDRTGVLGGIRRWPTGAYARLMTRRMTFVLPGEEILLRRRIPVAPNIEDRWDELDTDAEVTLPVLQALMTRYQLASAEDPDAGATNWTSYDQRMCTIGNLFRLRQRQAGLFDDPFDIELTEQLQAGA